MKKTRILLALGASVIMLACEQPTDPATPSVQFHHGMDDGSHLNAAVDRIWAENLQWEFVRPRPPGTESNAERIRIYQMAPVDENDPLSPAIIVPGVFARGEVDHVIELPDGRQGGMGGSAQTIPVLHPGWDFVNCVVHPVAGGDRIAYRILDPAPPPPCFQAATVYAVDLDDDGCFQPLTSADRIERAAELGLVLLIQPPEPPWPFAIRPLTQPGKGPVSVAAPTCVDP